jgi:hypothetical protein
MTRRRVFVRGIATSVVALVVVAGCTIVGEIAYLFVASRFLTLLDVRIEGLVPSYMFARMIVEVAALLGASTGVVVAARIFRAGAMVDRGLFAGGAALVAWFVICGIAITIDEGRRAGLCSFGLAVVWMFVLVVAVERGARVHRDERVRRLTWAPISIASPPT